MPYGFDIATLGRRTQTDQKLRLKLALGNIIARWPNSLIPPWLMPAAETARYLRQLREFDRVQHTENDRLPASRVATMRDYDFSDEVLEGWHKTFSGNPESNIQWFVTPLIRRVLDSDPSVKSVLNVGVKIAYFDSELALDYPDRQFYGVDFMRRVVEFNARYAQPNLHLISGYAREMLEKDEISADLVFFSSTAVIIRNKELRKDLQLIRKKAKYVVLNEPMYTFPNSRDIVDPSAVPINQSYLLATPDIPPGYDPPAPENRSLVFVHNYAAMLQEAGFEVVHYDIVMKDGVLPLMNIIGKAR